MTYILGMLAITLFWAAATNYCNLLKVRGELAMARHVINDLAPKAKAWDDMHRNRDPLTAWPKLDLMSGPRVESDLEANYRVAYQHLSAECDGCEEPATPAPRRRHTDRKNG